MNLNIAIRLSLITLSLFIVTSINGCSSRKMYYSDAPENMIVKNSIANDETFVSIDTTVDIWSIRPGCSGLDELGGFVLNKDDKHKSFGVMTDQPTYVQVAIYKRTPATSTYLGGEKTIIVPKRGEKYMIDVNLKHEYYEIFFKKQKGNENHKQFEPIPLKNCQDALSTTDSR